MYIDRMVVGVSTGQDATRPARGSEDCRRLRDTPEAAARVESARQC
jgi:hypothetical protein